MLKDAHYTNPALKSHANFPSAGVCACRCFLYAGSMQFLLVGLLAAGVDLGAVLLVTVAVNLRHIFYGLSFPAAAFQGHRRALGYAMFSLTDEAYSMCTQLAKQADWRLLTWVLLLCHLYWIGGTVLGSWQVGWFRRRFLVLILLWRHCLRFLRSIMCIIPNGVPLYF